MHYQKEKFGISFYELRQGYSGFGNFSGNQSIHTLKPIFNKYLRQKLTKTAEFNSPQYSWGSKMVKPNPKASKQI